MTFPKRSIEIIQTRFIILFLFIIAGIISSYISKDLAQKFILPSIVGFILLCLMLLSELVKNKIRFPVALLRKLIDVLWIFIVLIRFSDGHTTEYAAFLLLPLLTARHVIYEKREISILVVICSLFYLLVVYINRFNITPFSIFFHIVILLQMFILIRINSFEGFVHRETLGSTIEMAEKIVDSTLSIEAIGKEVVETVCRIAKVDKCAVRVINKERDELILIASKGISSNHMRISLDLTCQSVVRDIMESHRYRFVPDITSENIPLQFREILKMERIKSLCGIPLVYREDAFGLITVFGDNLMMLEEKSIQPFENIAKMFSISIHNALIIQSDKESNIRIRKRESAYAQRLAEGKISHEVRSPLQITLSNIESIKNTISSQDEKTCASLNDAIKFLKEAIRIFDRAFEKARSIIQGPTRVDIHESIIDVLKSLLMQPAYKLYKERIKTNFLAVNRIVFAEIEEVHSCLRNVIENALFAIQEKGDILIETRSFTYFYENIRKIKIWVKDTGIGMDESIAGKIFQYFSTSTKESTYHSGLGLPIARDIAEKLGGSLELEYTKKGEGSQFVISFPYVVIDEPCVPLRTQEEYERRWKK